MGSNACTPPKSSRTHRSGHSANRRGPGPGQVYPKQGESAAAEVHVQPDAGFRLSGLPNPKCPCTHIVGTLSTLGTKYILFGHMDAKGKSCQDLAATPHVRFAVK